MSRPRSVPKYRLHRASGQAIVTINGKTSYLGTFNSTASRNRYADIISEYSGSGFSPNWYPQDTENPETTQVSIAKVFLEFLKYAESYYGMHRTSKYQDFARLMKQLTEKYASRPADSFSSRDLKAIRSEMIKDDLSRKYINTEISRIKQIFKWACSEEIVDPSVHASLMTVSSLPPGRSGARETDPIRPVAPESIEAIMPHLPAMIRDMINLQRLTAARPSEICQLRWEDIDRSDKVWVAHLKQHKTAHKGKSRVIHFGPKAQCILNGYLDPEPQGFVFSPRASEELRRAERSASRKTRMSCGNRPGTNRKSSPVKTPGDHYDVCSYRRAIHRACKKAKIPTWSPNQLRHLQATEVRKLKGLEAASALLGHARTDVTEIYAERNEEVAKEIAAELG